MPPSREEDKWKLHQFSQFLTQNFRPLEGGVIKFFPTDLTYHTYSVKIRFWELPPLYDNEDRPIVARRNKYLEVYSQFKGLIKHWIQSLLLNAGLLHGNVMEYMLRTKLNKDVGITETFKRQLS